MPALPVEFSIDPAWPWSIPRLGLPALALAAILIAGFTLWTYRGVPQASPRRVAAVLGLRLLALLLSLLAVLRPSFAWRDDLRVPSTLLILGDASASMTIRDEVDNKARWTLLQRILAASQPSLDRLRDDHNVAIVLQRFGEDVADYDPAGAADSPRTDFGRMLHVLQQRHSAEPHLRGLLILSDGADNGTQYPALGEAARFRALGCPISCFALGQTTTTSDQRDLALTALVPEPSPVPVKARLTVRATVDAPGFENRPVNVKLLLDDRELLSRVERLPRSTGNEIVLATDAPAVAGEYRLTLKIDPLPGEATTANNEISTYLTVAKEGLSVLVIDRLRTELKFLRAALAGDPRIRLFEAVRQTDAPAAGDLDLFQFDRQAYDVIILGDISAARLRAASPSALNRIEQLVREKGMGLLMTGGTDSLGGDWRGTPVADALPVELEGGQSEERVPFVPTRDGLADYVLRLAAAPGDNQALWDKLNDRRTWLDGYSRLGRLKPSAVVLARARDPVNGAPLLVRQTYGKGRTAVLAPDTTWLWHRLGMPKTTEGQELLGRFWKQLVIYLAQQENQGGSVWVRPDTRRLPAGGKLGFAVGLRGKTGVDLPEGQFDVRVQTPDGSTPEPLPVSRERDESRGTFWKTDKPGEYRVIVSGSGKDIDGQEIRGETQARFLVYRDDSELLRPAADHEFLAKLAAAGGGRFYRADELPRFLQEFETHSPAPGKQKAVFWPDWRKNRLDGFLVGLFLAFVTLLSGEWALRRLWGLV